MIWVTIAVVAILTALIFALTVLAYHSVYASAKKEMARSEYKTNHERKKAGKIAANAISWTICAALMALAAVSIAYRATGNELDIGGKTSLVIASGSMSRFYDDEYAAIMTSKKETAANDHFAVGDILTFSRLPEDEELIPYDVYGYRSQGKIITHRYVPELNMNGKLAFRGDNTPGRDSLVQRSAVIYHWDGGKVVYAGNLVLFAQSWFGLYSCIGVACVIAITEIYAAMLRKAEREYERRIADEEAKKARSAKIYSDYIAAQKKHEPVDVDDAEPDLAPGRIDPKNGRKIKRMFTTSYGKQVIIYEKEPADDEE